jgi:uncharacterized protein with PIN domain
MVKPGSHASDKLERMSRYLSRVRHCPACSASLSMVAKSVNPTVFWRRDTITYRCTKCGSEKTETIE